VQSNSDCLPTKEVAQSRAVCNSARALKIEVQMHLRHLWNRLVASRFGRTVAKLSPVRPPLEAPTTPPPASSLPQVQPEGAVAQPQKLPRPPSAAALLLRSLDPAFQLIYSHVERGAAIDLPALRGGYEVWKAYIERAVREGAPASRELILANEQLAAWEAHLGIGRVASFPVTISVNLTEVCNARCSFCAYTPERVAAGRIKLEQIARADWLKFCKTFTPNGGGLGEPFAHSEIVEILEAIRKMAPYIKISIISNGSLLHDKAIAAITGFVDCLKISISAAKQETYERTMSPLKWDRTLSNLRRLRDEKQRRNTALPMLRAGYVLHTENVDELPQFPALIHALGFSELYVNVMNPPLPIASRQLMTRAQSVFNVPDVAAVRVAEMEAECARLGLRLIKRLPNFETARSVSSGHSAFVPVGPSGATVTLH
jgi:hypothetical protein